MEFKHQSLTKMQFKHQNLSKNSYHFISSIYCNFSFTSISLCNFFLARKTEITRNSRPIDVVSILCIQVSGSTKIQKQQRSNYTKNAIQASESAINAIQVAESDKNAKQASGSAKMQFNQHQKSLSNAIHK